VGEVRIAKKTVVAEVDEGYGAKIPRVVAIEGQQVPAVYADLVDDKDVDTEVAMTRSTTDRRAAAAEEREEPDHEDHRETVAAPAPVKRRSAAKNKARSTSRSKSKSDDDDE
jgi:hypothetical protein